MPNPKNDLLAGYKMNGVSYKVHLDGYNYLDYWTGEKGTTWEGGFRVRLRALELTEIIISLSF